MPGGIQPPCIGQKLNVVKFLINNSTVIANEKTQPGFFGKTAYGAVKEEQNRKEQYLLKFRQSKVNNTCVAPKFKKCPNGTQIHNAAPYLVGVLGVPEHPRNLGVQERGKPDFCFLEFSYYYEHPRIQKAKYGSEVYPRSLLTTLKSLNQLPYIYHSIQSTLRNHVMTISYAEP